MKSSPPEARAGEIAASPARFLGAEDAAVFETFVVPHYLSLFAERLVEMIRLDRTTVRRVVPAERTDAQQSRLQDREQTRRGHHGADHRPERPDQLGGVSGLFTPRSATSCCAASRPSIDSPQSAQ